MTALLMQDAAGKDYVLWVLDYCPLCGKASPKGAVHSACAKYEAAMADREEERRG